MGYRSTICDELSKALKTDLDGDTYTTNLFENVFPNKMKFYNEVTDYPSVFITAGREVREYLPGAFKWGVITVTIRVYVKSDQSIEDLEQILADIEKVVDANNELSLGGSKKTELISIVNIDTDEGLLHPFGVGEMTLQVQSEIE